MSHPLFARRSPRELAERGQAIDRQEGLGSFPRLSEIVAADLATLPEGEAPADWRSLPVSLVMAFGWADEQHRMPVLEGVATARIPAVCQRCLAPFELDVERQLHLLFTEDEAAIGDSGDYEVWETDAPTIRPLDVVEEAMIMAMPLSAMHNSAECRPPGGDEASPGGDRVRPFADLRSRMRDRR